MDITNKRVLVTGASQGIGEAIAREFAAQGATVALAARSTEAVEKLAAELGGKAYTIDLSDPDEVEGFIAVVEADGAIDVLVNNAGTEVVGLLDELAGEAIDQLLALNLATPFKLSAQVIPGMIKRGSGHIVQVSSLAAIVPFPAMTIYGASKAGLTHGTAGLEFELRGTGVGVTTAHLGFVETDMGDRVVEQEMLEPLIRRLGKMGLAKMTSPEKVASGIVNAVKKDKRHVLYPKNSMMMTGLSNTPRRMGSGLAAGLTFRDR